MHACKCYSTITSVRPIFCSQDIFVNEIHNLKSKINKVGSLSLRHVFRFHEYMQFLADTGLWLMYFDFKRMNAGFPFCFFESVCKICSRCFIFLIYFSSNWNPDKWMTQDEKWVINKCTLCRPVLKLDCSDVFCCITRLVVIYRENSINSKFILALVRSPNSQLWSTNAN